MRKYKLIILLICCIFFSIYMINQMDFLNILVNPVNTEYNIDKKYTSYLVGGNAKPNELAYEMDENIDTCLIFESRTLPKAFYTKECNSEYEYMASQSQKFGANGTYKDNTFYYDSIYEYLYSIEEMNRIDTYKGKELPEYSTIYVENDVDITPYLSVVGDYTTRNYTYIDYNSEFVAKLYVFQIKAIKILTILVILYIFYEYIKGKQKEYSVYELLGVSRLKIFLYIVRDYIIMITFSFIIATFLYYIIVFLNGNLFYIRMYFEHFSWENTIYLYIRCLYYVIPLALVLLYMIEFRSLEKRIR